jgi:transcriptional regulator with PAS, ATPase and Fis domain
VQIKLLQILQERTFSPVGSHEKLRFHGRVIAATNRPLQNLRLQGIFRDDFFYRLSSDIITVPPLRQRLQEDPLEMDELLSRLIIRLIGQPEPELLDIIRKSIDSDLGKNYPWPGNVRELEQAARRVLINSHYAEDSAAMASGVREQLVMGIDAGSLDAETLLRSYCSLLYQRFHTYEEVARRAGLDRRTVKKYIRGSVKGP